MSNQWSDYQKEIFDTGCNLTRSFIIDAKAGSGKTSTLVELANRSGLGEKMLFLAFNKAIVTTLQVKMPGSTCSTLHALGYRTLRNNISREQRGEVDAMKYASIFRDQLRVKKEFPQAESVEYQFNALMHYMMVTMSEFTPDGMEAMADEYAVNIPCDTDEAVNLCLQALAIGRRAAFESAVVNFDEMLYWPAMERWDVGTYHTVAVDEAQDLSKVQHTLIDLIKRNRLIACGDPNQAIYGFAGAACNSMGMLAEHFELESKPLSICYRCGQNIVKHAQKLVPQIEYWDQSPAGVVRTTLPNNLADELTDGCVVVCRTNAPLVSLCFKLIKQGIRAKIKGRDVGDQLIQICKQLAQMATFEISLFPMLLDRWADKERHKIIQRGGKRVATLVGYVNEKTSCLMSFYDNIEPAGIAELINGIKALFTDDTIPGVTLMSGHKSKGLEFHNVFVIEPSKIPLVWSGQTEDQFKQEVNLDYVVRTRAQSVLTYVEEEQ